MAVRPWGVRRAPERVLLVAGPTASGKSTYIDALLAGDREACVGSLASCDFTDWSIMDFSSGHERAGPPASASMVVHYNLLRPLLPPYLPYEEDPSLVRVGPTTHVTVVTLVVAVESLVYRIDQRIGRLRADDVPLRRRVRGLHMAAQVRRLYADEGLIDDVYADWLDYAEARCDESLLLCAAHGHWRLLEGVH